MLDLDMRISKVGRGLLGRIQRGYDKEDVHPRTLVEYVWMAQGLVFEYGTVAQGVEKIAFAMLRLARQIGNIGDLRRKAERTVRYSQHLNLIQNHLNVINVFLNDFILESEILSKDKWPAVVVDMRCVARDLWYW